jgi:hypothetical protein
VNDRVIPLHNMVQSWWSEQNHHAEIYVGDWPPWQDAYRREPMSWRGLRTDDDLIQEMSTKLKASAVEAALVLNDPEMSVAIEIAQLLAPPPYGEEIQFLADLIKAGGARSVRKRNWALLGVVMSVIGLAMAFSRHDSAAI